MTCTLGFKDLYFTLKEKYLHMRCYIVCKYALEDCEFALDILIAQY